MANLYDWSTTPADNDDADTGMTWAENQAPSTVNDSARQLMARVAEWRKDLAGSITTGGTGNAYTVTINSTLGASYPDGLTVVFTADRANGGSATLSVNGGAAVSMRHKKSTALPANALVANQQYVARYISATNEFIVSGSRADIIELAPSLLSAQVFGLRVGDPIISLASSPNPGFLRLTEATQAVLKADYPDLNSWASGLSYPWGSASTTFNLPPAAGYFLRFAGTTTSIDPDGPRTAGSTQTDLLKAHTHTGTTSSDGAHTHNVTIDGYRHGGGGVGGLTTLWASSGDTPASTADVLIATSSGGAHTHTMTTDNGTGTGAETRAKNVAFHIDILASPALIANGLVGASGYSYKYSTSTTAADPGSGYFRLDAAMGSATALYISETDALGVNLAASLATWDSSTSTIKGRLRLVKVGAPAITAEYDIAGSRTDNGNWNTFSVTARGTPGSFSDGDTTHVHFTPKGDAGAGGGGGGDVVGPASSTDGHVVLFNGATGKLIKSGGAPLGSAAFSATSAFDAAGAASAVNATLSTHTGRTDNPHSVTKAQVGLGNVDNTSDVNKPVSTAQQTALDGKISGLSFDAYAPDKTGATDVSAKLTTAIAAALSSNRALVIPAGIYRIAANITVNLHSYASQGLNIVGEGRATTKLSFDAGYGFAIEGNPADNIVFGRIEHIHFAGNHTGTFFRMGRTDLADNINEFQLNDLYITNGSSSATNIACQLNGFYNGYFNCVVNGGGFNEATKTGTGFAALDLNQCYMSTFLGSYGISGTGLLLRTGSNRGNVFLNVDTEGCTIDININNAASVYNTWVGGRIALATYGIVATAGVGNVFINPDIAPTSLSATFAGTTGIWLKSPVINNVTTPSFPASAATTTNNTGHTVIVSINGGSVSLVAKNGVSIYSAPAPLCVILEPEDTIAITYTGSPAWNWAPLR